MYDSTRYLATQYEPENGDAILLKTLDIDICNSTFRLF